MKALFGTLTKCGYVQSIIAGKLFATEVGAGCAVEAIT